MRCSTNNTTNKETTKKNATPAPLPAGGQAPALLTNRKERMQAEIKRGIPSFGIPHKTQKLTPEQFESKRQNQIGALRESEHAKTG